MIVEFLITIFLKVINWITSISLPDLFFKALDVIVEAITSFLYFLPQHPLIPWTAMAISLGLVLAVFLITIIYKLIRSLVGYFLGG